MAGVATNEKGTPLIAFSGNEKNAPILNYNLPALNTFSIKLFVPVRVPNDYWNSNAKSLPEGPVVGPGTDPGPGARPWEPPHLSAKTGIAGLKLINPLVITTPVGKEPIGPRPPEDPSWGSFQGYNPDYVIQAQRVEGTIKDFASSHPQLNVLGNLEFAKDLLLEEAKGTSYAKKNSGYSPKRLMSEIVDGKIPVWNRTFYGKLRAVSTIQMNSVKTAKPQLFVIEELEVASFFGDYGAGKTVKTFSMLPGEETTISVVTWRNETSEQDKKSNILDSYSQESADMFESQVASEFSTSMQTQKDATNAFCNDNASSSTTVTSGDVGGGFGVDLGIVSFGGGGGYSSTTVSQSSNDNSTWGSASSTRKNAASTLQDSLDKHVSQSSAARKHNVNIETSQKTTTATGEQEIISRKLKNINNSRVLNIVFRALNQEYLVITYLKNVSVGFTKGIPGDGTAAKLSDLDSFLSGYIVADKVAKIRNLILANLSAVYDFNGKSQRFVERVPETIPDFESSDPKATITYYYWRRRQDLAKDNQWRGKSVDGIILSTASYILPTDSIIADALLGQGEALDSHNSRLEKAEADMADLENSRSQIALDILKGTNIKEKADAFAEMFNPPTGPEGEIPVVIRNTCKADEKPE